MILSIVFITEPFPGVLPPLWISFHPFLFRYKPQSWIRMDWPNCHFLYP